MTAADLERLRQVPQPAFLWDAQRRRVAWANAAAVEFFGARGVADLVERPFDAREEGVRALQRAHDELCATTGEETLHLALRFPSTGNDAPLPVTLRAFRLADGRCGLLAVASEAAASTPRPRVLREILMEMPQPLLAVTDAGDLLLMNAAATELLAQAEEAPGGALAGLFPSRAAAVAFLLRARQAGTAVDIREVPTRLGARTLRLAARAAADDDLVIITLDDLTDRLRVERGAMPVSAPQAEAGEGGASEEQPSQRQQPAAAAAKADAPAEGGAEAPSATRLQPRELATMRRIMQMLGEADSPAARANREQLPAEPEEEEAHHEEAAVPEARVETPGTPETRQEEAAPSRHDGQVAEEAPPPAQQGQAGVDASGEGEPARAPARAGNGSSHHARISIRFTGPSHDAGERREKAADAVTPSAETPGLSARPDAMSGIAGEEGQDEPASPAGEEAAPAREEATSTGEDSSPAREEVAPAGAPEYGASPTTTGLPQEEEAAGETAGARQPGLAGEHGEPEEAREEQEAPRRAQPPQLVREVLDHRPEPIILHRADAFYFANAAARRMFGFAREDAAWDAMARLLTTTRDGEEVELADATGQRRRFRLKRDVFPWRAGVVVQSTLRPLKDVAPSVSGDAGPRSAAKLGDEDSARPHAPAREGGAASAAMPRRAPAPVIRIHADHGSRKDAEDSSAREEASATGDLADGAGGGAGLPASAAVPAGHPDAAPATAGQPDAELRAMLETAADGIVTLNARGEILSFSSGAERLFHLRADEVVGRMFRELLAEESRITLDACLARLLREPAAAGRGEHGRSRGREVLGLAGNGETIPLYLTVGLLHHALPRDSEHRASFCVVVHDISPFKRRETELRKAKEEAEELSARKSEFLARISHELRTPLNAILGFSDVLRQELYGRLGNEKYRDYARDIYDSGEHLLELVNDLLDLARIEAGRYELDMKEADLAAVVEDVAHLLRDQVGRAGITLRRVVPEGLPRVVADVRTLKQILLNLLSNAIKFSNKGDQVVVELRQPPDGGLMLTVKDTGPGMSREELAVAMEPFRRVSRTGEGKPGTGLGLPLARALAEANRARFEIDSAPGKGTEVRVIFPPHRVLA